MEHVVMPFITCVWKRDDNFENDFVWYLAAEDGNVPVIGDTLMLPVKPASDDFEDPCVDGLVVSRRWCFLWSEDKEEYETSVRLEVRPDVTEGYVPDNGEEDSESDEIESA